MNEGRSSFTFSAPYVFHCTFYAAVGKGRIDVIGMISLVEGV